MDPNRHNDMLWVRAKTLLEYEKFQYFSLANPSCKVFFAILDRKMKGLPLRAYYMHKLYEYLLEEGGRNRGVPVSFFTHFLPFVAEAVISIQYYHNQVLDGKGGVGNQLEIQQNVVISNLFKDWFYDFLGAMCPPAIANELQSCVRTVFNCVDIGQWLEKHNGLYRNWREAHVGAHHFTEYLSAVLERQQLGRVESVVRSQALLCRSDRKFLSAYLERIYLTNAILYREFTKLILQLLCLPESTEASINRFAVYFGLMHQIVNDNGDLVHSKAKLTTEEKVIGDAQSDLRNRTVTLPVCLHLNECPNGEIAKFLQSRKRCISSAMQTRFFKELVNHSAIYQSIRVGKALKNLALKELNPYNRQYLLLEDMCKIADNNKYYRHFYDARVNRK
ncbi:MAG: polyprenyl synthetase family protein [Phaeodactylibacter sp.]|nr:polyprenyl synthetase family protein [Phaeodactylibacter sp.]